MGKTCTPRPHVREFREVNPPDHSVPCRRSSETVIGSEILADERLNWNRQDVAPTRAYQSPPRHGDQELGTIPFQPTGHRSHEYGDLPMDTSEAHIDECIPQGLYRIVSTPSIADCRWLERTALEIGHLAHWDGHCQSFFGSTFNNDFLSSNSSSTTYYAILAFASLNLSRRHPDAEEIDHASVQSKPPQPRPLHFQASRYYYGSAVGKLARLKQAEYQEQNHSIQFAILLMYFMESSICNFEETSCHGAGLGQLLCTTTDTTGRDSRMIEIGALWDQAKCYNWWIEFHFSSIGAQKRGKRLQLSTSVYSKSEMPSARRAMVLSVLCETYRLTSVAFLQWWDQSSDTSFTKSGSANQNSARKANSSIMKALGAEKIKLEVWADAALSTSMRQFNHIRLAPEQVVSFGEQMDYIYYLAARIMCSCMSQDALERPGLEHVTTTTDSWAGQLMCVVNTIKDVEQLHKNAYSLGISGILLACTMRCSSIPFAISTLRWLKTQDMPEEGGLPLQQIISIIGAVAEHKQRGYDTFAIEPVREENGRKGKLHTYDNQGISRIRLHGVERKTGMPFVIEKNVGRVVES